MRDRGPYHVHPEARSLARSRVKGPRLIRSRVRLPTAISASVLLLLILSHNALPDPRSHRTRSRARTHVYRNTREIFGGLENLADSPAVRPDRDSCCCCCCC
ncbi:hypothetical protein FKP32DRAFT_1597316 [Trametes sanguinea]|nr:hypothetical protein FKP32DRAFT_1597316 [Trametes sanguinea]